MKYENTRMVTFKEDYYVKTKDGRRLLHRKSTGPTDRHAMHKGVVAILEKNGAKITVETLDYKKIEAKLKAEFESKKEKVRQ